ncbi:hypothetical protein PEC301879_17130 [Pectobacterium carotovorum subsp. carotovorum]|nr:hypothetical protein PEC301879_17130 [Pectobacterium carotovorum subsp. carotovorum]
MVIAAISDENKIYLIIVEDKCIHLPIESLTGVFHRVG